MIEINAQIANIKDETTKELNDLIQKLNEDLNKQDMEEKKNKEKERLTAILENKKD